MKFSSKMRVEPRLFPAGFTLVEIMVAVGVLSLVVLCMVSSQLFGLRIYTTSQTKLTAAADARKAMNLVRDQIRESKTLYVGNYDSLVNPTNAFPAITNGLQEGNALKILSTTNSTPFCVFYRDASTSQLKVFDSSLDTTWVLANYVTNSIVFDAENYKGIVLSNNQDNRVIRMTLQFHQREYLAGRTDYYNSYRLSMRATQRTLE